jgi:uncharacterized protein (TIGR02265 family)
LSREPVVSALVVEALFRRHLGPRLTPEVRARLSELGFELDRRLRPSYPQSSWDAAVALAVRTFHPDLPLPQAYHRLGREFVLGFERTLVGATVVQVGKLLGVERTMLQMPRHQRLGNNYIHATASKVGPGHIVIHFELEPACVGKVAPPPDPGAEEFPRGVYAAALELLGARDGKVEVEVIEFDQLCVDFHVHWTP